MASKDEKILKKMAKKQAKFVRKQSRSKLNKFIRKMFLGMFIVILCVVLFCVIKYGSMLIDYRNQAVKMVRDGGISAFKSGQTSVLYADDGTEINTLSGEKDMYYLDIDEIPFLVKRALISTEDRSFYKHSGVDYSAIVRATVELIRNKGKVTQGGSTITQQLSKLVFLSSEVSLERKVKEMFVAMEIENEYSKDQILEFYINNIYFANGYYGIQAAAQGYFSKNAVDLNLSEIAFLCSIPNNPSRYDPFVHFDNTMVRRDRILKEMLDQGDIDQSMYDEAVNTTIVLFPSQTSINNYVETYAKYCATIQLMKQQGFEFKYDFATDEEKNEYDEQYDTLYDSCSQQLYTGGYRIYTSIDLNKQASLQSAIDLNFADYMDVDDSGVFTLQSAATCIDNSTGYVVAIVGGRSQDASGYTLNRAYQSYRQPGSTIKPILVYTPMFERGYTPNKYVEDKKIEDGPVNSPNRYDGWISIRSAVEKSKNTVAWNLFQELTPEVGLNYLKQMEFKKIVKDDYVLAAAIGGMTYGVTTVEMASAYSAIENNGVFRSPTCIKRITDAEGNVVIDNTVEEKQVYEADAAHTMTDVLKGVLIRGTGKKYQVDNAICAAKTGTTNDNKDIWLCGYSRYYTTSVWAGYDLPKEITDDYVLQSSGHIWNTYMTNIHDGLEEKEIVAKDSDDDSDSDSGKHNWSNDDDNDNSDGGETPAETSETSGENVSTDETSSTEETQPTETSSETQAESDSQEETTTKKRKHDDNTDDTTVPDDTTAADNNGEFYRESWND